MRVFTEMLMIQILYENNSESLMIFPSFLSPPSISLPLKLPFYLPSCRTYFPHLIPPLPPLFCSLLPSFLLPYSLVTFIPKVLFPPLLLSSHSPFISLSFTSSSSLSPLHPPLLFSSIFFSHCFHVSLPYTPSFATSSSLLTHL